MSRPVIARAASSMQCATLRFLHLRFPGLFKAAKTYMAANATTATTRPVLWNPAEKLGISYGRSSKDGTTIIACYRRFCGPSRSAFSSPWRGLLSRTGDQFGRRTGPRRCPSLAVSVPSRKSAAPVARNRCSVRLTVTIEIPSPSPIWTGLTGNAGWLCLIRPEARVR
jgi:hypothetical protein